jgi:hypothetical protein
MASNVSRTNPVMRERSVIPLTEAAALSRFIERQYNMRLPF